MSIDQYKKQQDLLFQKMEDAQRTARQQETRRKLRALGYNQELIDGLYQAFFISSIPAGIAHAHAEKCLEDYVDELLKRHVGRIQ
jgi:hypothetical protein